MKKYSIGDVIEFRDFSYSEKKWIDNNRNYVGRIDRIIHKINQPEKDEWELWLEYYSEMPGAMYVTPERVIRVIEKGQIEYQEIKENILPIGTLVTFVEEGKQLLDEIVGYEYLFGDGEARWSYNMKHTGFQMELDEFEVVR